MKTKPTINNILLRGQDIGFNIHFCLPLGFFVSVIKVAVLEINPTMVTKATNVASTWTDVGEGPLTGTDDDDDDVMLGPVKFKVVICNQDGDVTLCITRLPFTDISVQFIPNCACFSILTQGNLSNRSSVILVFCNEKLLLDPGSSK